MKNKLTRNWRGLHGLRLLIVIILALGIFFRLVNLDRKVYWQDETATSLRIAGYTKSEFVQQVFNGQPISIEDLKKRYQSLNSEKSWLDTVKALTGRPEHSPLYYLMARLWAQWFGTSVAVMRSLPALISLLVFPGIYWLCLELFESSLVGWIAVALIAVSPVHVLYAQEARQYSLWTVTIVISSASLLRATRLKTNLSWGIYAATMALGLYSHLFFGLVALGHGIYIVATDSEALASLRASSFRLSRSAIAYLLASLAGLLTFLPWLWVMITYLMYSPNPDRITASVNIEITRSSVINHWFRNINRVFHDANLGSANIILIFLVVYSIYFVCCHTPKRVWLFILTLIGVTALTLGLPDLILGRRFSVRTRYLMPCYLGFQLAVAYLLASQITASLKWQKKFWQIVTLLLISAGVISGAISSQADVWWNKNISVTRHYHKIADIINQAESPLLISDGSPTNILCLSYFLEPNVKLVLVKKTNIPNISNEFSNVFLLDASDNLLKRLQKEKNYTIESVVDEKRAKLWKLAQS